MALLLLAGCDAAQESAGSTGTTGTAIEAASAELTQPSAQALLDGAGAGAAPAGGQAGGGSPDASSAPAMQPRADAPSSTTAAGAGGGAGTESAGAAAPGTATPSTEATAAPAPTAAPTTEPPSSTTASTDAPPTQAAPANPAPAGPAPASSSDPLPAAAAEFLALLNQVRAGQGLAPLGSDGRLTTSAAAQVDNMISTAGLFHQSLADELGQGWSIVGENVGYGPNVPVIHQALVNSPGHYQNLVNTRYTHVGIAVVTDGSGRMWVAQVFGG